MKAPVKTVCQVTSVHRALDARVMFHECRSLATRYRTILVCRDDEGHRRVEGVEIDPLPKASGRIARILGVRDVVAKAEALGADLYHFHDPELISPMRRLALRTGRPVIYDVHEHYPDAMDQKTWIPKYLRPVAAKWADLTERRCAPDFAAIVVSDVALKDRFSKMHDTVVQLDNFPPLSLLGPPLDRPGGRPTIAYVGAVSMVRGFAEMVHVVEKVRDRMPDARLVIYGPLTEEVAPMVAEVERRLSTDVIEFRGPVSYGMFGEALREAHVGLSLQRPHPKHEKNPSMKVFDYMAVGLPYVGSDFAPIRSATKEQGGILVAPGDGDAAADAVLRILSDRDEARRLGAEGRAAVEERLSWETVESRMFALYSDLLGESASGD